MDPHKNTQTQTHKHTHLAGLFKVAHEQLIPHAVPAVAGAVEAHCEEEQVSKKKIFVHVMAKQANKLYIDGFLLSSPHQRCRSGQSP